ncbi:UBX domain-containing protein 1 [Nymphon striatum]|nr:UBX domain-containing protein 1 [Nymphon striatum]
MFLSHDNKLASLHSYLGSSFIVSKMGDAERITGTLMEMGFSRPQIEKAIAENEINNVETIMEWLLSNGNDENNGGANQGNVAPEPGHAAGDQGDVAPARAIEENKNADANENVAEEKNEEVPQENAEANCFVCDECQKKFKTPVEVEFHAVKSGHQSFSESVEEIKPLTEEEIAEKKRLLEEKIRLRRKEKAEKDRQEAIQKEKVRRRTGQEVALSKQKIQEAEIKRLAEERRREKMEERLARQRVKEQIEKDRQARKEKFGSNTAASASASASTAEDKPPAVTQVAPKKDYDQCRLQPPPQQSWLYLQLRKSSYPMTVDVATYGKRFTNHRPPTFQNIQFQSWFPTENVKLPQMATPF